MIELRAPFVELTLRISAALGPAQTRGATTLPLPVGALHNRPVAQTGALKGSRGPSSSGLHLQIELRPPFVELTLRLSAARGPGRRSRGDDLPLPVGALNNRPVAQPGALMGSRAPSSSGLHPQVELRPPFVELTLRLSAALGPRTALKGDDLHEFPLGPSTIDP